MPRRPTETHPPRMEPRARLPLFFSLAGKRAVVAGGTPAAAWKAELLSAAGATVDALASEPSEEMVALAADPPQGAVVLHRRAWQPQDLLGGVIAIGSFEDNAEAARFAEAARSAG